MKIGYISKKYKDAIREVDENIQKVFQEDATVDFRMYDFPYRFIENKIVYLLYILSVSTFSFARLFYLYITNDVLHYCSPDNYFWIYNIILKKIFPKTQTILTVHHLPESQADGMKKKFYMKSLLSFDKFVVISEFSKIQLIQWGVEAKKITVIRNGISKDFYPEKINNFKPFKYILFVGDEYPRKNLETALVAFKCLVEKFPDIKFIKLGRVKLNHHKTLTDNLIKKLNFKEGQVIVCRENISINELRMYYSNAKMLVSPSVLEGFGLPVIEACRCKSLVLISSIAPYLEFNLPKILYVDKLYDSSVWFNNMNNLLSLNETEQIEIENDLYGISLKYDWNENLVKLKELYLKK